MRTKDLQVLSLEEPVYEIWIKQKTRYFLISLYSKGTWSRRRILYEWNRTIWNILRLGQRKMHSSCERNNFWERRGNTWIYLNIEASFQISSEYRNLPKKAYRFLFYFIAPKIMIVLRYSRKKFNDNWFTKKVKQNLIELKSSIFLILF